MFSQKYSLDTFKMTDITQTIFSNSHGIKLEINKRETRKITTLWK